MPNSETIREGNRWLIRDRLIQRIDQGSVQEAAQRLGVRRYQLYRLIKYHGLVRRYDASG